MCGYIRKCIQVRGILVDFVLLRCKILVSNNACHKKR